MEYNSDFRYDLSFGFLGEETFASLFSNKTVEVKTDRQAHRTGNIYIELLSRNNWSGLSTTTADYMVFIIQETGVMVIFPTFMLKKLIKTLGNTIKLTKGGDSNSSLGVLLSLEKLHTYNKIYLNSL
jgi:hypothetical protein